MIQFQAPVDILGLRKMQMLEDQQRINQEQQMFDGISGAIDNLLGAYVQHEEKKAKGRAMKNAFGVIAPSLGMDENTLKQLTGNLKSDNDWYNFGAEMGPMLPSLINANQNRVRMQDASSRMYQQETLRRERETINNPPAPAPITVPTGMRRFVQQPGGI